MWQYQLQGKKIAPTTPAVEANKNPMTDYWATPPGHTLDLEERDLPEMNTFAQQGRPSDQPRNNNNQPRSNDYKPHTSGYEPPNNDYQPPRNQTQHQSNHYQAPSKHYQVQSNDYQPTSNDYQPPTSRRPETQVDQDGLRRPQSFVERIRNAENSDGSNVQSSIWKIKNLMIKTLQAFSRDSQLWSYSNPGVRKVRRT